MFEEIISLKNLFNAWTEFKKDKSNKTDVVDFELNLEDHIFNLHKDLSEGLYRHGKYASFFIHDPKLRHIHKAPVRDRLLHHAVHRIIEPLWNETFIFDSWSSRKNKGTHAAVKRLQKIGFTLSRNNTRSLWVLKLDVRKFFHSVDHDILLAILQEKTFDPKLQGLFKEIIQSYSPGLPLGNLTSQLFANVYMNKLDQFVKNNLKIQCYVRYADDFILIHSEKEIIIDCLDKIKKFLQENLHLNIHPDKIVLNRYTSGIDYLGYICFPHYRVLRSKTKHRMFQRVNEKNFTSYNGVLKHCRGKGLQTRLLEKIKPEKPPRQQR